MACRRLRDIAWICLLGLLAACDTEPRGTRAAPPDTEAALDAQPRMALLMQRTPPDMGFSPGTTPWSPLPEALTAGAGAASADNPGAAFLAFVAEMDQGVIAEEIAWEETTRLKTSGDRAVGIVLQWGYLDDAVAGRDFRVSLRHGDAEWRVVGVEQRFHCRRGVADGGYCR